MKSTAKVTIRIASKSEEHTALQTARGELTVRKDTVFLRYQEPDQEMGKTVTTVKVKNGQITVIRHGDVESRQTFSAEKSEAGYYATPHGKLPLIAKTRCIHNRLQNGLGTLRWSYDLFVSGQFVGHMELTLDIQEE
jgi:uncharacterized beta-barrel protein YwiB (DUF1934 family)